LLDPAHPRSDPVLAARSGDAVQRVYERMAAIVGEVVDKLEPDTTLLVISDHGFHSYRIGLNLNSWLRDHGFLVQGSIPAAQRDADFFPGVDWSRSRAYALGTGQIYVNLRGREGHGIVAAGAEYDTPGIALASRALRAGVDAAIVDLAPTALAYFGVPVPSEMAGHALLEGTR